MVEPCMDLTEDSGVIVGHTLVDASSWSASVLMVNPNADEIVLPWFHVCWKLGSGVGCIVALAEPVRPGKVGGTLPDHLEDIVMGMLLRNLQHRYVHDFPAPGGTCDRTYNIGIA